MKKVALRVLVFIEWLVDFHTSPLPPMKQRLEEIFGRYEIGTTRFIKKNLRGGVTFDIGANVGYYARLMACYADRVYAFEPDPDNFKILEENCRRHPNITPLNMAVCDRVGTIDFFKVTKSAMRHSIIDEGVGTEKLTVQCTSLDAFIAEHGIKGVKLIKMDVEGAEPLAFEGMQELLARETPIVIYEGDDPKAKAISENGDIIKASDAAWWGSRKKVTNLVR
ncbi:MAG: FkbM family methyltransferase [Candidatus Paceibacterota bacterium]|jgi:FkbM family methyltransferase